ncbi:hypothetical protein B40_2515 [Lactococcus cremoris]|nr:hypothetical protein B40_2515 [Lactococcus cremoris]
MINEDGQKSIKRMFEGLTENQESQTENFRNKVLLQSFLISLF